VYSRPSPPNKLGKSDCDLPLIIVFKDHRLFQECVENDLVGYFPYIIEIRFDWLSSLRAFRYFGREE